MSDALDRFPLAAVSPVGKVRWQLAAGETLAEGLARILIEEIVTARAGLDRDDLGRTEIVHRTRRGLKRIRAVLVVLESVPGANQANRVRQVRDIARLLADARDADVLAAEARRLRLRADGKAEVAVDRLIERLDARAEAAHARTPPFAAVAARLRAVEADARSLPRRFDAGRLLAEALVACYRGGRRDWRDVEDGASGETLHDWRKKAKLRRQFSQLVPFTTVVTGRSVQTDLDTLAEILGEEHDLALLKQLLVDHPDLLLPPEGRDALLDLLAQRRRRLGRTAIDLGGELYDLRTRAFAAEIEPLRELC